MKKLFWSRIRSSGGFTLLEVLVSMVIFTFALMALSSLSVGLVGGNVASRRNLEAAVWAQAMLENLRYYQYNLGGDMVLGTVDDTIDAQLANSNTTNDLATDPAVLFETPDHAYTIDASGFETTPVLDSPTMTLDDTLRRVWVVRDNYPVTGMKTVTVVVGWVEGKGTTVPHYMTMSTAIQEKK